MLFIPREGFEVTYFREIALKWIIPDDIFRRTCLAKEFLLSRERNEFIALYNLNRRRLFG